MKRNKQNIERPHMDGVQHRPAAHSAIRSEESVAPVKPSRVRMVISRLRPALVRVFGLGRHTARVGKTILFAPVRISHTTLLKRSSKYAIWCERWKLWRWHAPVKHALAASYALLIVTGLIMIIRPAHAIGTWTQTDWSGGVGASTTNQYSSGTNVATNVSGVTTQTASGWPGAYASWAKRKPVTITNSGSAQTDYQVQLSISYASAMKSDFSDLRFTNNAGTALPYWVQSKTDSTSAVVWVKADTLAAAGTTDIYMYYGNAAASSESNGTNVFQLFDDFNGVTLDSSKWNKTDPGNKISVADGKLKFYFGSGSGGWGDKTVYSKTAFARSDLSFEYDLEWKSNYSPYNAFMIGWKNEGTGTNYPDLVYAYYLQGDVRPTQAQLVYEDGSYRGETSSTWSENVQYNARVRMRAGGGAYYDSGTDGITYTTQYTSNYSTATNLRPGFVHYSGDHTVDNARVRKWQSTEPTASYSSEETKYQTSGVLTSAIHDNAVPSDWGALSYNVVAPSGTSVSVKVRTGSMANLSDASAFSSCSPIASGGDITSACAPDRTRYAQYQVTFSSTSAESLTFQDISLDNAASDTVTPITNASTLLMKSSPSGSSIGSNAWTNAPTPYFSWTAGADDNDGSGIKGYCLYLGTDNSADPVTTKGLLGTSPLNTGGSCQFAVSGNSVDLSTANYIGTAMTTSNSSYYLLVKAIDNANNVYDGSSLSYQFRFDNSPPTNPAFITAPSQFIATKDVTLTWPTNGGEAPADSNAGLAGLQYRIGNTGTWYGVDHSGSQNASDLLTNSGSYQTVSNPDYGNLADGNNIIYFRTWDSAGNISSAYVTTVIKINTSSPSPPQNVTPSPSTNTTNSFGFSWLAPATFTGSANNITYCYTINALPNVNNCTFTAAGVTSLPAGAYATQPGDNTIYVVARDEAQNINYATAASATFTANTSAPGVPLNMEIADISNKDTSAWKLAVSWNTPSNVGAGIASYKVFRSANGSSYDQIASTPGVSYVDTGLSQTTYYYKIKACDSANNCGAFSGAVSRRPTGKFTTPAGLISQPSTTVSTRSATVVWTTDRVSDSRIQYGTQPGQYFSTEAANSTQVTSHEINLDNLNAGTTYYFKANWVDIDGNLGVSSELSFTTLPAPTVSDVSEPSITLSTANIQFTSKGATKVKLYYGKSKDFGSVKQINTSLSESVYIAQLTGLDDGATYYFKVNTFDQDDNEYDQTIFSFQTPARPRISNLKFQPVTGESTSTQKITWDTNVPSSSLIRYSAPGVTNKEVISTELKTQHEVIVRELIDDTSYTLTAESRDKDGNVAISDPNTFRTALDTRTPKVTDITIETSVKGNGAEGRGQIIVSWKTDEPATSQVGYGEGSGTTYNNKSSEDDKLTFDHVVIISDLATSKVYHVQPLSKDKANNLGKGEDQSAIIGQATDNVLTIILNSLQKVFGL